MRPVVLTLIALKPATVISIPQPVRLQALTEMHAPRIVCATMETIAISKLEPVLRTLITLREMLWTAVVVNLSIISVRQGSVSFLLMTVELKLIAAVRSTPLKILLVPAQVMMIVWLKTQMLATL
jgi:hypothetical protein